MRTPHTFAVFFLSSSGYHNPRKRSTEELLSDAPQKGSMVVPNSQLATGQRAGGQQGNLNVQRERIRANPKPYQVAEGPGGSGLRGGMRGTVSQGGRPEKRRSEVEGRGDEGDLGSKRRRVTGCIEFQHLCQQQQQQQYPHRHHEEECHPANVDQSRAQGKPRTLPHAPPCTTLLHSRARTRPTSPPAHGAHTSLASSAAAAAAAAAAGECAYNGDSSGHLDGLGLRSLGKESYDSLGVGGYNMGQGSSGLGSFGEANRSGQGVGEFGGGGTEKDNFRWGSFGMGGGHAGKDGSGMGGGHAEKDSFGREVGHAGKDLMGANARESDSPRFGVDFEPGLGGGKEGSAGGGKSSMSILSGRGGRGASLHMVRGGVRAPEAGMLGGEHRGVQPAKGAGVKWLPDLREVQACRIFDWQAGALSASGVQPTTGAVIHEIRWQAGAMSMPRLGYTAGQRCGNAVALTGKQR
eukprot:528844-Pelagomonas_calceolata.AAC.4